MKKSCYLLILIFISLINLVSASYHCSNESNFIEGRREIKLYDSKTVNEIKIGVIYSNEIPIKNLMQAEIIFDAEKFSLSSVTKSVIVELNSGVYNVSLNNITNSGGLIAINGASKTIEEKDTASINGLDVFIFNTNGAYPGEGSLEGIVGTKKIFLSSEKPEIVKLNGISYLLELNFASSNNIIIIVKKCNTGEIIEIKDEIKTPIIQNTSVENETQSNANIQNTTLLNDSIGNYTDMINISEEKITSINNSNLKKINLSFSKENIIMIILSVIPIFLLVIYLWYNYNKKR